jgi:hypothetical protein
VPAATVPAKVSEEEARAAWMAKLGVPSGEEVPEGVRMMLEACVDGDEAACIALNKEAEAKEAWLTRLEKPEWATRSGMASEAGAYDADAEEAKLAWLARKYMS